jgi:replicative DNA helicase
VNEEGEEEDFTVMHSAKNRQGPTGHVVLRWEGHHSRLLDPARDDDGRLAA